MSNSPPINLPAQGPLTSHQSASRKLPSVLMRRGNMSAPATGFPIIIAMGPYTNAGTPTAGAIAWRIPASVRLMAFGWAVGATGGASTMFLGRNIGITGAITTPGHFNAAIDLVANPSGVIYFNDTGQVNSTIANYLPKTKWVSGIDSSGAAQMSDPECPPTGATAQRLFFRLGVTSASGFTDLCCYILCWPTTHINADRDSD